MEDSIKQTEEERLQIRVPGQEIGKLFQNQLVREGQQPGGPLHLKEGKNPNQHLIALIQEGIDKFHQNMTTLDLVCTKSIQGQTTLHREEKTRVQDFQSPAFDAHAPVAQ